jgi:hypothetical protein
MFPDPISRQTPDVIRILYEFRRGVELKEAAMLDDMATRWLMIESRLDADITALAYELQRLKDEGKIITESVVLQSQRYKTLKEQIEREIEKYNREYAVGMITDQQAQYAKLGIDAAQTAMRSAMGTIGYNFNMINLDAVKSMIGFAGNGSPLYTLLQKDYGDAVHGLTNALINGIARGYGPMKTAREMANGFGMGLDRAILIARTETIRSYRTATTEQYRASGAVTGFRRLVWKPTACLGCLMRDGEYFDVAEELSDHPSGKCTSISSIRGVKDVQWETGKQWFNKLSPEEQRAKMGAEKYQLWKDGQFKLDDLSKLQHSAVWGDSPRVATISELLGGGVSSNKLPMFSSIQEAEQWAKDKFGTTVDFSGLDLNNVTELNKIFNDHKDNTSLLSIQYIGDAKTAAKLSGVRYKPTNRELITVYGSGNSTWIGINKNNFNNIDDFIKNLNDTGVILNSNTKELLTHEWAHVFDLSHTKAMFNSPSLALHNELINKIEDSGLDRYLYLQNIRQVSGDYFDTNSQEFFAETYRLYDANKLPDKYNWMKEFFKSIGIK